MLNAGRRKTEELETVSREKIPRTFEGYGVAPGIAIGRVALVDVGRFPRETPRYHVSKEQAAREVKRFEDAVKEASKDVEALARQVAEQVGEAEANILRGHSMMLQDPSLVESIREFIQERQCNAEYAVAEVMGRYQRMFESMPEEYLRDRAMDVRDVTHRLLGKLLFVETEITTQLQEPRVVVAEHLVPSLTVRLQREYILAFATEKGGATSHAAILARSAGIPAVSGLEGLTSLVEPAQMVIIDGFEGKVITSPTEDELKHYRDLEQRLKEDRERCMRSSKKPVVTLDGAHVTVMANVGRPGDVAAAAQYGADGIGLYRTEFEYMSQTALPTEDELAERYGQALAQMRGKPVVFRVLDVGGDKFPPAFPLPHEDNPYLGCRGIRVLLQHPDELFRPQLRAILRAAVYGQARIMYPMIAGMSELQRAMAEFEKAKFELEAEGVEFNPDVPQGIMIEVPSAVAVLDDLLSLAEFGSVGTNDLVQYTLAADRNNDHMVDYYDPLHPAIVRTLWAIGSTAQHQGKAVSVCGEIAGDPLYVPLLLGLGFQNLSASPGATPFVKDCLRHVTVKECEELAHRAVKMSTADEVRAAVIEHRNRWRARAESNDSS